MIIMLAARKLIVRVKYNALSLWCALGVAPDFSSQSRMIRKRCTENTRGTVNHTPHLFAPGQQAPRADERSNLVAPLRTMASVQGCVSKEASSENPRGQIFGAYTERFTVKKRWERTACTVSGGRGPSRKAASKRRVP